MQLNLQNSCESLSKFCIFACFKNYCVRIADWLMVVNRFQNFVSLHALKTIMLKSLSQSSCESLSKFCIFACFKNILKILKLSI